MHADVFLLGKTIAFTFTLHHHKCYPDIFAYGMGFKPVKYEPSYTGRTPVYMLAFNLLQYSSITVAS
jgi:hypothetical protein